MRFCGRNDLCLETMVTREQVAVTFVVSVAISGNVNSNPVNMKKLDASEIERRMIVALAAINRSLGSNDDTRVDLFASHYLDELDPAYWRKHAGTPHPTPKQIVNLLELRSHWGKESHEGIDAFDFSLPGDVTDYVISVHFNKRGEIEDISMES
jgi:hypothetical protein